MYKKKRVRKEDAGSLTAARNKRARIGLANRNNVDDSSGVTAGPNRAGGNGTAPSTKSNAAYSVFYTTELLQEILEYLPVKDLMKVRRVCHKWNDVILGPALKRITFLHPEKDDYIPHIPAGDPQNRKSENPVVLDVPRAYNPLVSQRCDNYLVPHYIFCKPGRVNLTSPVRKMLIAQPPVTTLYIVSDQGVQELNNPKGVTIGDILEAASPIFDINEALGAEFFNPTIYFLG